jgi:hypothetical protein
MLQYATKLFVAIDGAMQLDESAVSIWSGIVHDEHDPLCGRYVTRVTMTSALFDKGLEFDGRAYLGTEKTANVVVLAVAANEYAREGARASQILARGAVAIVDLNMKVRECRFESAVGKDTCTMTTFEALLESPPRAWE